MDDSGPPSPPRCPTPGDQEDYDVRRMHEGDFEKLAVYVVKDVHCERGTAHRADKTLPRSLTLKPSLVLSTPNAKVRKKSIISNLRFPLGTLGHWTNSQIMFCVVLDWRCLEHRCHTKGHQIWPLWRYCDAKLSQRHHVMEILLEGTYTMLIFADIIKLLMLTNQINLNDLPWHFVHINKWWMFFLANLTIFFSSFWWL